MAVSRGGGPGAEMPGVSAPGFVGRGSDVTTLIRALSRPPVVVLIEGEAGIGKSRLLQEALARRVGRDVVLVGACVGVRDPFTLGPVIDAVRAEVGDVAGLGLSPLAGALRPLFPEWAGELPGALDALEDAAAARHRLFRALSELLERLHVAVLVIEDAHWADEATLEFLLFLLARLSTRPDQGVVPSLVVTYRPEEVAAGSPLRKVASRLPQGVAHALIEPRALDVAETAELVSSMLAGEPVSDEFAAFLRERTDGLPLAIEGLVRLMADRADLFHEDGAWARVGLDELRVPPTVRDSTLERLERLPPAARAVLRAASVLADWVLEDMLREVARLAESADDGVLAAQESGLLIEDARGRLGFRHVLARDAIYGSIPPLARRELHLRAGTALEAADPRRVASLARHFKDGGQVAKWLSYAEQAADMSIGVGDHRSGIATLSELVERSDCPMPDRLRVAKKLTRTVLFSQDQDEAAVRRTQLALRRIVDGGGLTDLEQAEFRLALGKLLYELGEFDSGAVDLEVAATRVGDSPAGAQAMVLLGWPLAGPWSADVHLRWLRRAGDLTDTLASESERFSFSVSRAIALLQLGESEGWPLASELLDAPHVGVVDQRVALAGHNIGWAAMAWGRYEEARLRFSAAREVGEATGHRGLIRNAEVGLLAMNWEIGAWAVMRDRLNDFYERQGAMGPDSEMVRLIAAKHDAVRGRAATAGRQLERLLQFASEGRGLDLLLDVSAALGRLRLSQGDIEGALKILEEPIQRLAGKGVWIWGAEIVPIATEILVRAGRVGEARDLVRDFSEGLMGRDAARPHAGLAMSEAFIEQTQSVFAAASTFSRAARAYAALPRPYEALLAREHQCRCLLNAGQASEALALMQKVFQGLDDLGASLDASRVRTTLRGYGVQVRSARRGGRPGYGEELSPREQEVVQLVIAGRTNRQIADTLMLSPRTVAGHVASAMRKLNVSSRTALAVRAVELGTDPA